MATWLTIGFIDDLCHAYDVALIVANGHAEYGVGCVAGLQIDFAIEASILVGLLDVNHLLCLGHHASDADAKRYDDLLGSRPRHCILECCKRN